LYQVTGLLHRIAATRTGKVELLPPTRKVPGGDQPTPDSPFSRRTRTVAEQWLAHNPFRDFGRLGLKPKYGLETVCVWA
jgi:hypothetical protein